MSSNKIRILVAPRRSRLRHADVRAHGAAAFAPGRFGNPWTPCCACQFGGLSGRLMNKCRLAWKKFGSGAGAGGPRNFWVPA
jgi:hypothetical protein